MLDDDREYLIWQDCSGYRSRTFNKARHRARRPLYAYSKQFPHDQLPPSVTAYSPNLSRDNVYTRTRHNPISKDCSADSTSNISNHSLITQSWGSIYLLCQSPQCTATNPGSKQAPMPCTAATCKASLLLVGCSGGSVEVVVEVKNVIHRYC